MVRIIRDRPGGGPAGAAGAGSLRRTVIEASKQCGRNRLMEIAPPQRWEPFVQAAAGMSQRLLAHPEDPHTPCAVAGGTRSVPDTLKLQGVALAVGPEGGFTDEEVVAAQAAGWTLVDSVRASSVWKRPRWPWWPG